MSNLTNCASYPAVRIDAAMTLVKLHPSSEVQKGMALGAAHALPLILSMLTARLSLSAQSIDLSNPILQAFCTLQFLAPSAVLSFCPGLARTTKAMLWISLVLGGISNGLLLSFLN
ncbi:MAG: hypothetical protein K2X27_14095 [Candidatus Obscuribacterales bacterium]|nr:hypothetical protein [Candidatus Obscuribacterales bacterium]